MNLLQKHIVLIGLMGAGKSRVGQELSRLMNRPFSDSDKEIEAAAGLTIQEIFDRFGEEGFRQGERGVLQRLLSHKTPGIIASGGGAFIQSHIREAIRQNAVSVWLRADIGTLVTRAARSTQRPLLKGVDKKTKLQELAEMRNPVYAKADIIVDTDGQSPQQTAKMVHEALMNSVS